MYFTESIKFAILNLRDVLFSPNYKDDLNYCLEKMNKTYSAFFTYYKMDKKTVNQIMKAINEYDTKSKTDSVVDVKELERFYFRRTRAIILTNDKFFKNNSSSVLYALLYRYDMASDINDPTTYTALIPLPPDERFIVFITFDENEIYRIQTVASPNQYDLDSPVYLVDLNVAIK